MRQIDYLELIEECNNKLGPPKKAENETFKCSPNFSITLGCILNILNFEGVKLNDKIIGLRLDFSYAVHSDKGPKMLTSRLAQRGPRRPASDVLLF